MNPPETNDPLESLLSEQNPYIDDNGFTARVVAGLPPRRRPWLRPALVLGATALGYGLALRWMPWGLLSPSMLLSFNAHTLLAGGLLLAVGGSLLWGVVAAFAEE